MLYEKFRWKPRAQGVFTIGSYSFASSYGTPNLFFPIGNYRYVWNTEYDDLFVTPQMQNINIYYIDRVDTDIYTDIYTWAKKDGKNKAKALLQELVDGCIDYDLYKGITKGNEVMFDCNKYYLVSDLQYNVSDFGRRNELETLFARIIHG